jgi:putative heme-binding domain-containing protein
VNPYDPHGDLNRRARSYLHVNCSHCHRENAGGSIPSVMNIDAQLDKMKLVNSRPALGDLGLQNAKVVAAGDPFSSVLLFRTSASGRSRMPYLGSHFVDSRGVTLLREWIASLSNSSHPSLLASVQKDADPQSIVAEQTRSTSAALRLAHSLMNSDIPFSKKEQIAELAVTNPNPLIPELFQQFLSNPVIQSDEIPARAEILASTGNAERGTALIRSARLNCLSCHAMRGEGKNFGPEFGDVARRQTRIEILDNILQPSRVIAPAYTLYLADRDDDEQFAGLLVSKNDSEITLRDQTGTETHISKTHLKSLRQQTVSAMPEGLLRGLTPREAADILEAILALK